MEAPTPRPLPAQQDLWYDEAKPTQMGCTQCPELSLCGGLNVNAGLFDCMGFCPCASGGRGRGLCPRAPRSYVTHVRQVSGFALDSVRRVAQLPFLAGHRYVPMMFDSFRRTRPLAMEMAALPLMHLFNREAEAIRFLTPQTLRRSFMVGPDTRLIVSGVADDRELEAWWLFRDRPRLLEKLRTLGVEFATAPNYSLFTDVTRFDNMHNMKRIALTWAEFTSAGIACALHLNGRTPRDYERWRDFVGERPEVTAVAFEFLTGARGRRGAYHRDELIALAEQVGRPLTLVVRGGSGHLHALTKAYAGVWVLDSNPQMKTKNYQTGTVDGRGQLTWSTLACPKGTLLDDLMARNIELCRASVLPRLT